jgi:hypothetical protein
MSEPALLDKLALLARTRDERAALDDVYAKLTADELCAPVLEGGRSIKDVLAHITAWERRVLTAIAIGRTGETPPWPEPGFNPWDTDKLNERDFIAFRERPLEDVLAEAHATYVEYLTLIESFSPDEIAGELPYTPGIKLESIIRGHADEHYREHLDAIEPWRAGQSA